MNYDSFILYMLVLVHICLRKIRNAFQKEKDLLSVVLYFKTNFLMSLLRLGIEQILALVDKILLILIWFDQFS